MPFSFYYKSAFLFFFFTQGLIFAFLLLRKGIQHLSHSSKYLSFFVLLSCFYLCPWMLGHEGWYAKDGYREFLFFMPFHQLFLMGPLIYFYTKSLLSPDFRISKQELLHFTPGLLYLVYSLVVFITDQFILDEYYFYADGRDKDLAPWYQISGLASMIIYTGWSIRQYHSYRRKIFQELSYADTVLFAWINRFLVALFIILSLRILFMVLYPEWGSFGQKWWYYLFFALLSYYIALSGYSYLIESISYSRIRAIGIRSIPPHPLEPKQDSSIQITQVVQEAKAETFIPDTKLESWKPQILHLIEEEQLYQNPTLTLHDLAQALGTTSKQVSYLINQGFNMNFNDFVNHYRTEAVKKQFEQGAHEQYTVLSIALNCGFNSKTTFNRVFKRNTSLTPQQYLAQLKNTSSDQAYSQE